MALKPSAGSDYLRGVDVFRQPGKKNRATDAINPPGSKKSCRQTASYFV
jgi:hypothetical protein